MVFDAQMIVAITGLISVIGNIALTLDARRRSIRNGDTLNVLLPKVDELHALTNGQAEKLNTVSRALGRAEGLAEANGDRNAPKT